MANSKLSCKYQHNNLCIIYIKHNCVIYLKRARKIVPLRLKVRFWARVLLLEFSFNISMFVLCYMRVSWWGGQGVTYHTRAAHSCDIATHSICDQSSHTTLRRWSSLSLALSLSLQGGTHLFNSYLYFLSGLFIFSQLVPLYIVWDWNCYVLFNLLT